MDFEDFVSIEYQQGLMPFVLPSAGFCIACKKNPIS
jgi:hypothetical protein